MVALLVSIVRIVSSVTISRFNCIGGRILGSRLDATLPFRGSGIAFLGVITLCTDILPPALYVVHRAFECPT